MGSARTNKGIRYFRVLLAAVLLVYVAMPVRTAGSETTGVVLPQKGMCYVTWDRDRFATEYSDASLAKLADMGVEYVSIVATLYQEQYNTPEIQKTGQTPTDRSIRHVIKRAHKLGLKIMLKPHIDLMDKYDGTYWRADIGFACEKDWKKWFKNYKKFILHYARMARKYDVEIFCVGTELSFTTQRETEWRDVIADIKKVYSGKLVYAANWDNYKNVKFWDELDYIGIDAYFPLTYNADPTLEDLKQGWEKWINEIELWRPTVNRPVIFTEIGYASTSHAPYTPWKGGTNGNADPEIQAMCYEAFFQTVWNKPWLAGAYWWKWDTNTRAGGNYNRQFTPQNKPAQRIIEAHYKGYKAGATYAMAK